MDTGKTPAKDTPKGGSRKALTVVGVLGAIAVNIAAFIMSAAAITAVAKAAGEGSMAWAMVPSVDGLMITGTVVFIARKLHGRSVKYPLGVLLSGVGLSIVCNALHSSAASGQAIALSSGQRTAVSAIPAVALALSFHLIADMVKDSLGGHVKTTSADASPEASVSASPERPQTRLPEVSRERLPSVSQTPAAASPQTPKRASAERPKTPRQAASKTATTAPGATRKRARELLKNNPDMDGAQLARALGRNPSGTYREMRTSVLAELRDAGELPSVRALGA